MLKLKIAGGSFFSAIQLSALQGEGFGGQEGDGKAEEGRGREPGLMQALQDLCKFHTCVTVSTLFLSAEPRYFYFLKIPLVTYGSLGKNRHLYCIKSLL